MRNSLFIVLILSLMTACSTKKKLPTVPADQVKYGLRKGACFGRCPVFTLSIYPSGLAKLKAERFMEKEGEYELQLSAETMKTLAAVYGKADFSSYPERFESRIPDLPSKTVTLHNGMVSKTVTGKEDLPEALEAIIAKMSEIVEMDGWKQTSTPKTSLRSPEKVAAYMSNEFIIQSKAETLSDEWYKKYEKFGVKLIKQISPDMNYFLVTYDESTLESELMFDMLKSDPAVKLIEYNKRASARGGRR